MARHKKAPAAPPAASAPKADAPEVDASKEEPKQDSPKADPVEKAAPHVDVDLVTMTKGGESLDVHHTCVADHARLGWKVAQ